MKFLTFFKKSKYTAISVSLVFLVSLTCFTTSFADFMQSTTYKIQADSLNFGGLNSSSTTYKLEDTMGEVGTGDSNSSTYYMHAGYQQMGESFISITSPSDLNMTSMGGISGGSSEGTISWTVVTDNTAGYSVNVSASTTPALKSATDSLADYVPSGANPDYTFTNPASDSSFGFSPEGADVITRFKDNGIACNIGTSETASKCWDGLSTTPKDIVSSSSSNQPSGTATTVRFRAESGASHMQTSGTYTATITITAVTL